MSRVTAADLEAFVQMFQASDWDEVDLNIGDEVLHLSKCEGQVIPRYSCAPALPDQPGGGADHRVRIRAPHTATVHLGAIAGSAVCVKAGEAVTPDSVVCTLHVMQKVISLKAGEAGTISQVCAVDGALVQCGDVLFVIDPPVPSAGGA